MDALCVYVSECMHAVWLRVCVVFIGWEPVSQTVVSYSKAVSTSVSKQTTGYFTAVASLGNLILFVASGVSQPIRAATRRGKKVRTHTGTM